ncbi:MULTISPECIES: ESX secretion-associated protein EspG [unclassified Crossiella]|uniref:ESX secretion-associated protein EspG n=1 Tax=unclassified Crossiella TaxID=2620835 RepID=UPI001FFF485A|nr:MULTISPECIES: ESX secretion-associated protein EspG [unclassified Crossiella]MCK2240674.1 ESX secretion-associated protein EspG [Crossiella sp. S99.2]MCK2252875.1 ESX secretion-associated protein EspG [Crossiella sp. S99.1]
MSRIGSVLRLSGVEFEACWEYLQLGELPYALDLPSPGRTWEERRQLLQQVLADLTDRGLVDRGGLVPELVESIAMLARFRWAIDGRVFGETSLRFRGAVDGEHAVLAVLDHDHQIELRQLPDHALIGQLVALTGDGPAPRVASANVREAVLEAAVRAAGDDLRRLPQVLVDLGEPAGQASALAHACTGILAMGQFSVVIVDQDGTRRGSANAVGWHTTEAGRFVQLRNDGWVTVTPGGPALLVAQLRQLVDRR